MKYPGIIQFDRRMRTIEFYTATHSALNPKIPVHQSTPPMQRRQHTCCGNDVADTIAVVVVALCV